MPVPPARLGPRLACVLCLTASAFGTAPARSEAAVPAVLTLVCAPAPGVAAEAAIAVCDEFGRTLARLRTDRRVTPATNLPEGADAVSVAVQGASPAHVALQLTWHRADGGPPVVARPLAVSTADRPLSARMRDDFYARLLADTPPPY
jgi:hypothetical protein